MKKTPFSIALVTALLLAFSLTSIFSQQTETKKPVKTTKINTTKTVKAPKPMVKPESKASTRKTISIKTTKTEKAPMTSADKKIIKKVRSKSTTHKALKVKKSKRTEKTEPTKN